jgi:hypothetical protein
MQLVALRGRSGSTPTLHMHCTLISEVIPKPNTKLEPISVLSCIVVINGISDLIISSTNNKHVAPRTLLQS